MNYWFELKYTLRLLRKKMSFSVLCVFVIAMGIGVSLPMLSLTKLFGFQDLAVANGERMVVLKKMQIGQQTTAFMDAFVFQRIAASQNSYEKLGAFQPFAAILSDGDTAESYGAARILPTTMDLYPVTPILGRSLQKGDELPGTQPVAVIGYSLWQNYYAGNENIIGRQSRINGDSYTIVGVMPEGYSFPTAYNLWTPLQLDNNVQAGASTMLHVIAQMKEGVTHASASVELNVIVQSLAQEFPEFYSGISAAVMNYTLIIMNDGPIFGQLILGMVVIILCLVCFNVTSLLTVRSNERIAELAIRGALGGTAWRIMRQVLLESLLVCLIGAVIGLGIGKLALLAIESLISSFPGAMPFWISFKLQTSDILALLLITLSVWLLSGLHPAWQVARQDISQILNGESGSIAGSTAGRLTRVLVTLEIIASCFLLIVGMYFVVGMYQSSHRDMGIEDKGYLSARVDLSSANYHNSANKLQFMEDLKIEILRLEPFQDITFSTALAGQRTNRLSFGLDDRDISTDGRYPTVGLVWESDNYAELMGLNLLAGRYFDSSDSAASEPVVVVDELFVEKFWPGQAIESVLGQRVQLLPNQAGEWMTVIGVSNHIIQGQPTAERLYQSTLYRPFTQLTSAAAQVQSAVGTISMAIAAASLTSTPMIEYERLLKSATNRVDRDIPVLEVMPLSRAVYLIMEAVSVSADAMILISIVTLILAVVGIYGVVSRSVWSRAKEIGIRRALGSSNFTTLNIFLKQGASYLLIGILVGGVGGVLMVDLMSSAIGSEREGAGFIFSITMPVMVCLGVLVFAASYIPARKLLTYEPGEALHYE